MGLGINRSPRTVRLENSSRGTTRNFGMQSRRIICNVEKTKGVGEMYNLICGSACIIGVIGAQYLPVPSGVQISIVIMLAVIAGWCLTKRARNGRTD